MLNDLALAAKFVGLEFHAGNTKVLSNGISRCTRQTSTIVQGLEVEMFAAWQATEYVGKTL